ncbi:hemolysin-III related-domain-containing protein [Durotheca rogersii]|uniref:hemolysin-III related-domain-containing protein n=1 Tax=Durotheca rogersii TaxID=419775 RepID=UPI00221FFC9A|nr:hemolysin-III related-domain-containing protein [Durotheca rogersii]KAI5866418.1 hemolysin-III related-domain-containing protein [Durotheca rogersii]
MGEFSLQHPQDHASASGPSAGAGDGRGLRQRRRSSSAASALARAAASAEHKLAGAARQLLLGWDELPAWRRDNQYIATGYRPESGSFQHSLASLFYVHNESVNIWTHLLGALTLPAAGAAWLAAALAPAVLVVEAASARYPSAGADDVLAFACFFAGALLCLGMNAISNHSPEVAKWGNKLDYSGIVFLIVGSYIPALYYGLFCLPDLRTVYLCAIFLLGLGCGMVSWIERFRTPLWRPYRAAMFVGLGVSGVVPICHALCIYGYRALDERMGLSWVLLQGFLYIFGAFLYAVRWPERSFPRTFDIWGSSHQLFHILILLAAVSHFNGMVKAFDYHHSVLGGQC